MTMISENWARLLEPGLRKVFQARMRQHDELFLGSTLYPVESSSRAFEEYQGVGELATDGWNEFEKTGRTAARENALGWKTRLEHREFTQLVPIRRKLIEDNLYSGAELPTSVTGKASKLADSAAVHREQSAAALFNNAFTDTGYDAEGFPIAGADGVGLCSTAHEHSPTDSTTQSNEGTAALSAASLEATRLAMRKLTDDQGTRVSIKPDTLLVPVDLYDEALRIVGTPNEVDSANNTINVNRGRFTIIEWHYLTDTNAWFLIDSMLKSQHLVWLNRVSPEFRSTQDYDTVQAQFRGYYRYSRGFDAWQWIYGNNPS